MSGPGWVRLENRFPMAVRAGDGPPGTNSFENKLPQIKESRVKNQ